MVKGTKMNRNGSHEQNKVVHEVENFERLLLLGQFLTIVGSAILSTAKVLELFKNSKLPSRPILESQTFKEEKRESDSFYTGRRHSYFE